MAASQRHLARDAVLARPEQHHHLQRNNFRSRQDWPVGWVRPLKRYYALGCAMHSFASCAPLRIPSGSDLHPLGIRDWDGLRVKRVRVWEFRVAAIG